MKLSYFAFFISSLALAQPEIIPSPVKHLYVPHGFDSNDSVEVVVTGLYPNACYSRNKVEVKVQGERIDINVTAIAPEKNFNRFCPDMVVPFKEDITIGNLQGGEYEVRVNAWAPNALTKNLMIAEASSNAVDEHLYAAIEWVERKSKEEVVLHGWNYSNCVVLDKVQVSSNGSDTLAVLPIMKQVSDFCPMKMMPVAIPVKLDMSSMKMNEPLLHVRTMDGKSVNAIVNLVE
jgi:hypothetical protein